MLEKLSEKQIISKNNNAENNDNTAKPAKQKEIGGFEKKLEPTRFGDWDVNGRCSDF